VKKIPKRNYSHLLEKLHQAYYRHAPKSAEIQQKARQVLVDGGSHSLRLIEPFPPRIRSAKGGYVTDDDGNHILDFWQGHYANLLGHNSPVVTEILAEEFQKGNGLQTGFTDSTQAELAFLLCQQTGADKVRFTTSGTLSTMYSILLARAFTGREMVLKVGGGWHGAHLWGLKGVTHQQGFKQVDSVGVPDELSAEVIVTQFNDPQRLEDDFRENSGCLACFILEPVIGAGGMIPATQEYLQTARRLCDQFGVVLIFDEVVSGFRYRAGDVGKLYNVRSDLLTLGKVIGGGMPVAAVGGKAEIMTLVGREAIRKVKFSGGTYSGHPASMLAAKVFVKYLVGHEAEIYPRLEKLSAEIQRKVPQVFSDVGFNAFFAGGHNDVIPNNSLHTLAFPYEEENPLNSPNDVLDPEKCDVEFVEQVLKVAMLLENVHIVHGLGAVSTAHTEDDIDKLCLAYTRSLERIRRLSV
jgi:glutamate-1-semialdehyde 2,1-aminomutase